MRIAAVVSVALFCACVPLANWMLLNVGTCSPGGPCVLPVGLGLYAPSGVLLVGVMLVLRDVMHATAGLRWALAAVVLGAALTAALSPALALASGVAFLVSEALDALVYQRLRVGGFVVAALGSSTVGLVVDSALFLVLAFGSLQFLPGQVLGKAWAVLVAVGLARLSRVVTQ